MLLDLFEEPRKSGRYRRGESFVRPGFRCGHADIILHRRKSPIAPIVE